MYIYIYMYIYVYVYIYICIYIYRVRRLQRQEQKPGPQSATAAIRPSQVGTMTTFGFIPPHLLGYLFGHNSVRLASRASLKQLQVRRAMCLERFGHPREAEAAMFEEEEGLNEEEDEDLEELLGWRNADARSRCDMGNFPK